MGEIADMMVDGVMCQCGEYIGEDAPGHPRFCSKQCEKDFGYNYEEEPANKPKDPKTVACPEASCERKFRTKQAAAQHWVDKHE